VHRVLAKLRAQSLPDLALAARSLRQSPAFSLAVLATLALGIGANVAVFSVFEAVLLKPLPYGEPERVAMLWSRWNEFPDRTWISEPEYVLYRREMRSFEEVAAFGLTTANLTGADGSAQPERVNAAVVTPNLFRTLGVAAAEGRTFLAEEGTRGRDQVVVIGEGLWRRRFGGDPKLVGRAIEVDRSPMTVVGILPADFRLPLDFRADAPTEILAPMTVDPHAADAFPQGGGNHGYYGVARLRRGVTVAAARAELDALIARMSRLGHYPPNLGFSALLVPVAEEVAGAARPALLALLGAVGFVLLTACANVASLLLAQREEQARELAVRAALGASRGDLVRYLLAESLLLAAAGGAAGLWLADLGLSLLARLGGTGVPRLAEASIDGRAVAFAAAATALAGLLASLAPALQILRGDLAAGLAEGGREGTAGVPRERLRRALVAAQVAMALMLTAGAGLMVRSLVRLLAVDPGFRSAGVLTFRLAPPQPDYPQDAQVAAFYSELLARIRRLPGVEAAGAARRLPMAGDMGDWSLQIEGYTPPPGSYSAGDWQVVTPGYLEAMGIRLLAGRTITEADGRRGPFVVLVSESMARAYWPGGKALGGRVRVRRDGAPWMTVAGIVADVKQGGLGAATRKMWYWPHAQMEATAQFTLRPLSLAIRTGRDPLALAPAVREVVRDLDPRMPLAEVRPLADIVAASVARQRFTMTLFLAFGAVALALAAVGVYGVVAYSVARRTREIGIRMAMGAQRRDVLGLVVRRAAALTAAGLAVGLVGTAALGGLLAGLVYGLSPSDPPTLAGVVLLLAAVALGASWLPARRAARLDPLTAIRHE
jgi:putative ABC transport system permease protein